jgi:hypothetical protein
VKPQVFDLLALALRPMKASSLKAAGLVLAGVAALYWSWHVGPSSPQTKIEEAVAGISLLVAAYASLVNRSKTLRGSVGVACVAFGVIMVDQYVTGDHDILGTTAFALIFLGLVTSVWSPGRPIAPIVGFGLAAVGASIWIAYDASAGVMVFQPGNVAATLGFALSAWSMTRTTEERPQTDSKSA